MKKVVVVAVHPDDETIMCGGTLLKHKANGDEINWLLVTNISVEDGWAEEKVVTRQQEIEIVSKEYGFSKTFKLNFPTTKLDSIPIGEIVSGISNVFYEINPEIVYLPNYSDIHTDHQIAFQASFSCTKSFRYPFIERILMGEALSETEFAPSIPGKTFTPNVFFDISETIEKKLDIFSIYKSEVMPNNMPRSMNAVKSLASYRGSRIGASYAEAFQLLFEKK